MKIINKIPIFIAIISIAFIFYFFVWTQINDNQNDVKITESFERNENANLNIPYEKLKQLVTVNKQHILNVKDNVLFYILEKSTGNSHISKIYSVPYVALLNENQNIDLEDLDTFQRFLEIITQQYCFKINPKLSHNDLFINYSLDNENYLPFVDMYANFDGDLINRPLSIEQFIRYTAIIEVMHNNTLAIADNFRAFIKEQYLELMNAQGFGYEHRYAQSIIQFFNISNQIQIFNYNPFIGELNEYLGSDLVKQALENYKAHYNTVENLESDILIEQFKTQNFIKVPQTDEDICFIKVPKDVTINTQTVGQINFDFTEYELDAYNCNKNI